MSEPTTEAFRPNLSPWFALTLSGQHTILGIAVVLQAVMALLFGLVAGDPVWLALSVGVVAVNLPTMLEWYVWAWSPRLPATITAPLQGRPAWPFAMLGAVSLTGLGAGVSLMLTTRTDVALADGIAVTAAIVCVVLPPVCLVAVPRWRRSAEAAHLAAAQRLQSALAEVGYRPQVHATSAEGASLTITTSDGDELIWSLSATANGSFRAAAVHALWRHMKHYGFRRAWIVTPAGASPTLVDYASRFGIVIAHPARIEALGQPAPPSPDSARDKPVLGATAAPPVPCPQFVPRLKRTRSPTDPR